LVSDPFAVLGVSRNTSLAEVRAARRRLAFDLHPDRGGDATQMQELNAAFDAVVAHITGRRPMDTGAQPPSGPTDRGTRREPPPPSSRTGRERGLQHDVPSFVIEALPAEAFEALLVVASWIGEVLVDEPPYLLEVHVVDPVACWCRLDLVPDAGASTVSLMVAGHDLGLVPSVEEVRDVWVANLNRLGRDLP
jgi:hypothetical protein